jgi:homoaconitase/3-isopropylmalate dehydratase large subunit/3-isopropylmalate dehydratase small subunit
MPYSADEVRRIARLAGHLATRHRPPLAVHSIDKANVLATSRLWRRVVTETFEKEFPTVPLHHHLVDSAAMLMVKNPRALNGIVLTENMFGDILSDEASVIPGSLGLLPSASLNDLPNGSGIGLYEPIHGSAPDIAGKGIANPIGTILSVALMLRYSLGLEHEARAVENAVRKTLDPVNEGGHGYRTRDLGGDKSTAEVGNCIVELLRAELNALTRAEDRGLLLKRPAGRRPMTLCEKIIAHGAIGLQAPGDVRPGQMVCVSVDWTLASELTWKGMEKTYDQMGRPAIPRNDRFWLAIDHTVDPRINDQPKPRELISASRRFAKEANLVDFYEPNYTILHTEFCRERAQPGMIVIGADSHSCSAGNVGAFAVGLGAADVVMPLVTGETWFKVPETVEIRFVGRPPFGIGGKDIILYVLGELKRNTVAFERAVEFTGPGLRYLSCDARFAISNMTTEFGGIAGVFEADEITAAYIAKRKDPQHKNSALYFRADPDAEYAESHIIDLSKVDSLVALYPSPDNVVPAKEVAGMKLDGCFIGACTTAEEDLILAALVLEAGLKRGWVPTVNGKRKVTPGSVPIIAKLRRLGLLEIYEKCGFEIGAPGCSYCIAVAADRAGEGEVWLSSQNRNFKNRMGKGSIGNLASAATVAASSFDMTVRDPRELLNDIDPERYEQMLEIWKEKGEPIIISEPNPTLVDSSSNGTADVASLPKFETVITGRVQRFGDHVDTDAIIPAEFMPGVSDEDLGTHAFQYFRPEFRERVKAGRTIVVGGIGFGSGSSREEAPRALRGAGVKCVIARSYAFIYGRNQPMMSLLGITINDDRFYELAQEDVEVRVDVKERVVECRGERFPFGLSLMEERLMAGGGVTEMYKRYGGKLFRVAMQDTGANPSGGCGTAKVDKSCTDSQQKQLAW